MSNGISRRRERKKDPGLSMRIDCWEKLHAVLEIVQGSLPINITIDVPHPAIIRSIPLPIPYDPGSESSIDIPIPFPVLAEVRVSLYIDEWMAWLLPVHFCLDQVLTAQEVVKRLTDAFSFLHEFSQVHTQEARETLGKQPAYGKQTPVMPSLPRKYSIH